MRRAASALAPPADSLTGHQLPLAGGRRAFQPGRQLAIRSRMRMTYRQDSEPIMTHQVNSMQSNIEFMARFHPSGGVR